MNRNPFNMLKPGFGGQSNQIPPINQQQFKQFLPQLNDNMLNQLIQQARNQGMSEKDIQTGLDFINRLR